MTLPYAEARVFHWPELCPNGEIILNNKNSRDIKVWLQKFNSGLMSETEITLSANSKTSYKLEALKPNERHSLLSPNANHSLHVKYICNSIEYSTTTIEGGIVEFSNSDSKQLIIQNLYSDKNMITINLLDSKRQVLKSSNFELASFEKTKYNLNLKNINWNFVQIKTTYKYAVFLINSDNNSLPVSVLPQKSRLDVTESYFLVSPRESGGDDFIVKINNIELISKARELIKNPQNEKMLFAKIQKDPMGFNRNWNNKEKSFWSWSVSEVTNFDDLGSIACNGTPQSVEDRIDYWIQDPGQICFWNYRIKKELNASEVSNGIAE